MPFCSNCGAEVQANADFCYRCGARLYRGQTARSLDPSSPQDPSYSGSPPPASSPEDAPGMDDHPVPRKRRHGRGGTVLIATLTIAVAAVLVLMAMSQGWVYFNTPSTDGSGQKVVDTVGNYSATYSWTYPYGSDKVWTIGVTIPKATYANYTNEVRTADYASYVTKDDAIIDQIASELKNDSEKGGYDTAQFVLSFVQNIPYGTDENTTGYSDYPRYPVETLVDDVGDCKDHSTLYASLLDAPAINDDAVLFELLPQQGNVGHMAVGLWGQGYTGTYVSYEGRDYYYCETTSPGWRIGEMPQDLTDYSIQVMAS